MACSQRMCGMLQGMSSNAGRELPAAHNVVLGGAQLTLWCSNDSLDASRALYSLVIATQITRDEFYLVAGQHSYIRK